MPIDEPRWWYDTPDALPARLLQPIGWIVGRLAERRFRSARPFRAPLAIVCIGNFTAGGTGKTPLAIEVARLLRDQGETPVFLSRGYGGTERGPYMVEPARDPASVVGDEPLLLAGAAPTFISRDRAAGARFIAAEVAAGRLAATVVILDDGLQNPSLAKDVTLAVVDRRRGFGNGRVLPAGPLRAALDFQMPLADAVIVNTPPGPPHQNAHDQPLREHYRGPILSAAIAPVGDIAWLREKPLIAFAGIGNPRRFFDLVRSLGGRIAAEFSFADHQPLSEVDAARILAEAGRHGALIVTTEKDLVRLGNRPGSSSQLRAAARALPIRITLADADQHTLAELLRAALAKRRSTSFTVSSGPA